MLFITDSSNCIKIRCGGYTISLSKQSSWYNVLIDNANNSLSFEDAKELTGIVYKIIHPKKEWWGRWSEWAIEDFRDLKEIFVVVERLNDILKHEKGHLNYSGSEYDRSSLSQFKGFISGWNAP